MEKVADERRADRGEVAASAEARPPRRAPRWLRDRLTQLGLAILVVYFLVALFAPALTAHDPLKNDLTQIMAAPSLSYPLGTDHLGRSLWARVAFGARISLSISFAVVLILLAVGVSLGAIAGYYRGRVDTLVMRAVDVLLAFPSLILVLAIAGMLGPSLGNILIALVAVEWVKYARVVRGQVLSVSQIEYVEAARATGASGLRVIGRHILPNVISPVIILATLDMGYIILAISALSFLGLGAQAPTPEWGRMLSDATPYMQFAPRLMIVPGTAIFTVVLACNLLGDGLRDALDPKGVTRQL